MYKSILINGSITGSCKVVRRAYAVYTGTGVVGLPGLINEIHPTRLNIWLKQTPRRKIFFKQGPQMILSIPLYNRYSNFRKPTHIAKKITLIIFFIIFFLTKSWSWHRLWAGQPKSRPISVMFGRLATLPEGKAWACGLQLSCGLRCGLSYARAQRKQSLHLAP